MASSIRFELEAADGTKRGYDLSDGVEASDFESQAVSNDSHFGPQENHPSPSVSSPGPKFDQRMITSSPQHEDSVITGTDDILCYGTVSVLALAGPVQGRRRRAILSLTISIRSAPYP